MPSDFSLRGFGKATVDVLKLLIGAHVGKDALCQMLGYIENAGAPTSVTPDFIGQKLFDTTNLQMYFASGTTTGQWVAMSRGLRNTGAPTAKTTSTTLTAAELLTFVITGNQGGGAAATYTTPTGTLIETALIALYPDLKNNDAFDFSVANVSVNAAETVTIAAGATVTLFGDMTMAAVAVGDQSSGLFRCVRTSANNYSIYRIA